MLLSSGKASLPYWICAFAVNQHLGICNYIPEGEKDAVTGLPFKACACQVPKVTSGSRCEMNKFDDMMERLFQNDASFAQIVAVDRQFSLFQRAWCVAELVAAQSMNMMQHVKLHSQSTLHLHASKLGDFNVTDMKATRAEDVDEILCKIPDKEAFNTSVKRLIFDPKSGLLSSWLEMESSQQMSEAGRLLKWSLHDDGSGSVWRAWG